MPKIECSSKAATHSLGISTDSYDPYMAHPVTQTHQCTGYHSKKGELVIHRCACGATFYMLEEALNILINQYMGKNETS